jgi:hypothetical protein
MMPNFRLAAKVETKNKTAVVVYFLPKLHIFTTPLGDHRSRDVMREAGSNIVAMNMTDSLNALPNKISLGPERADAYQRREFDRQSRQYATGRVEQVPATILTERRFLGVPDQVGPSDVMVMPDLIRPPFPRPA